MGNPERGSPDEQTMCVKCQHRTQVTAALPVGQIVYLRCPECGTVWPIAERRNPLKMRLPPTPASDEGGRPKN